jgi:hypothetical protein
MRSVALLLMFCCGALTAAITQPQFYARRDYPSAPGQVAVADVNGDGIPDLITIFATGVDTLLGNGNGTFRVGPKTTVPGAQGFSSFVPIDLNGDGKTDLVIGSGGIEVCLGNGDGTFQPGISYAGGGAGYVVVGDFNGDGIPDAVVPDESGIWLYTGKGGGVFNLGVLTPINPSGATNSATLAAADFNGDGYLDLAVAYRPFGQPTGFIVLFGNGNGTFQTPVFYSGTYPTWIAAGDLNGDGHPDIVVATSPSAGDVYIYLNDGQGGFSAPTLTSLPGEQFAIGYANRDDIPDLVSSTGFVALGLGNGTFSPPVYYPVESSGSSINVVLADLRKDGRVDIIAGQNGATSVLLNTDRGTFIDGEWTSVPGSGNCGAAADFNGDGKPDLAVPTTAGIVILVGTGKASAPYTTGATIPLSGPGCPITGDLNGDGIPDLLIGANSLGGVGAYLGNGDGTFTLASVIPVGPATVLVLGDFNHDGRPDFADSSNELALGNGDGTFQAPVPIIPTPPSGLDWIAAGDVNNDGWTDLVATAAPDGQGDAGLYVLLNNQMGGFTVTSIKNADGPVAVMLADLNADGNLDAVVTQSGNFTARVYLGNGQGGFTEGQAGIEYPFGFAGVLPAQIGDVNGDGIPDLLLPSAGSIGIALGTGKGTFATPFAVGAGPGEGQILLQNLHGQSPTAGLPDLVAPDSTGGVMVLLNITK